MVKVGIIGGSGLDDPQLLENRSEKSVTTPFGKPSDVLIVGSIKGVDCVLLARHGRRHSIQPSDVNYRANIWALKEEGCTHLIVTTACGSLQENIHPGEMVLIDDFIDSYVFPSHLYQPVTFTKGFPFLMCPLLNSHNSEFKHLRTHKRKQTFYDGTSDAHKGVSHVPMNEPFCPKLRKLLSESISSLGFSYHEKGTMVTIEGPRFSTRAESALWRQWNCHVVNMSTVPEVVLAKEAGILYASVALVTDYDSWRDDHEAVHVELAMKTFRENAEKACKILLDAIPRIEKENWDEAIQSCKKIAKMSVMGNH